jgi:uncharacterized protein (TIGR00255 family)
MSLSSMTGFARAEGEHQGLEWHWELRAVNGKGLDLRLRLPPGFDTLEPVVRDRTQKALRRGNIQAALQITRREAAARIKINETVLEEVLQLATALRRRLDAPPVSVEGLLQVRGILEVVEPEAETAIEGERQTALVTSFETALGRLIEARREEGGRLAAVLGGQLARIAELSAEARANPSRAPEAIRARLAEQVERLCAQSPPLDAERLNQEAMLLAVKADIREELDRLDAHVAQGRELIASGGAVGRRLDFLAQEFNREANTLCSKSNDAGLTRTGLELKTVIDQMREQVQNIE